MVLSYVDWEVFYVSVMDENNAVLMPDQVPRINVREVLPHSTKLAIKETLNLSYFNNDNHPSGGIQPRTRSAISIQSNERSEHPSDDNHDSGDSTDEEYREILNMVHHVSNHNSGEEYVPPFV
ncbi:hypothetical protein PIB30_030919 [Stylosanthes scabra]|uniref:Uncharacterized protein n=1 Tax=Stylosanthes scabra TaxID=79078 RepID=A0ABU6ZBT0_9FABA|nr:hypothetical protein [Stylosanthes scabra]